jgi:hypothetical protein
VAGGCGSRSRNRNSGNRLAAQTAHKLLKSPAV